jgi:hypothetical protein
MNHDGAVDRTSRVVKVILDATHREPTEIREASIGHAASGSGMFRE